MIGEPVFGSLQIYEFLKTGDVVKARHFLENALKKDLENPEILYTLKCISFWEERLVRAALIEDAFERGEYILLQWKQFAAFLDRNGRDFEQSLYSLKCGIFSIALEYYQVLFHENDTANKPEICHRTGLCLKQLGNYEYALRYLEAANSAVPDSAAILSQLADCYALCGEVRTSKVLFREAFFIDPQKIELSMLDSDMICRLSDNVAQLGYTGAALSEWIPVYGVLYEVFNVKRELRAVELGRLKQAIYTLENSVRDAGKRREPDESSLLVPRLINHYFWLIDHYMATREDRARINEVLLKIKLQDSSIYNKYTM
ncbi:MAG: hypothetical protein LBU99_04445 [Spirochaetaceae bacterium]|nr:hypothetical protein [Spirochaetaceae bacterium]